jgi:glycosyltransferase involved in cell wall biosynthesis
MPRVLQVCTIPSFPRILLAGRFAELRAQGFEVAVVSSTGDDLDKLAQEEGCEVFGIDMEREPSPLKDLVALYKLCRVLRKWRPDIVDAGNPKAGLLGMLAARITGVPVRVYTLHGLRLETTGGLKRRILGLTEWLASKCAHTVVSVSESLRDVYVEAGYVPAEKTVVLGKGSANGLRADRFATSADKRRRVREELGIAADAPVVGFVGRFTHDKGLTDLWTAFATVREKHPDARLLLVGDFEPGDPVPADVAEALRNDPAVILPGFVRNPEKYYHAMDVLALPSKREGFGTVVLEANAAKVPVVGYDATGLRDAIIDGVTGTLVPTGYIPALAAGLRTYLDSQERRRSHGAAGYARVKRDFAPEVIWNASVALYRELLGLPTAATAPNLPIRAKAARPGADETVEPHAQVQPRRGVG